MKKTIAAIPPALMALFAAFVLSAVVFGAAPAAEAAYPDNTITVHVPWNAGSNTDMQIRLFQPFLKKHMPGNPNIIIVNTGGGSGTIGTMAFLNEKPDGYSILFTLPTPIVFKPLSGGLKYTFDDLQGVARFSAAPMLLAVRDDAPYKNAAALIEHIKANPSKFTFAHAGSGGIAHLAFEKFLFGEKLKAINVPFAGGTAECYSAVMGGHVESYVPGLQDFAGREGIRAIINLGSPNEALAGVPTLADLGYEGYVTDNFSGFYFKKGVDREVVKVWESAVQSALNDPEFQETSKKAGLETSFAPSAEFHDQVLQAIESSYGVMKEMGLAK